jgi:hypothetical protein
MKIVYKKEKEYIMLGNLNLGDVFEYCERLYIKVGNAGYARNSLLISNNQISQTFHEVADVLVLFRESTLTIED